MSCSQVNQHVKINQEPVSYGFNVIIHDYW